MGARLSAARVCGGVVVSGMWNMCGSRARPKRTTGEGAAIQKGAIAWGGGRPRLRHHSAGQVSMAPRHSSRRRCKRVRLRDSLLAARRRRSRGGGVLLLVYGRQRGEHAGDERVDGQGVAPAPVAARRRVINGRRPRARDAVPAKRGARKGRGRGKTGGAGGSMVEVPFGTCHCGARGRGPAGERASPSSAVGRVHAPPKRGATLPPPPLVAVSQALTGSPADR
jgi:hypothetical protein